MSAARGLRDHALSTAFLVLFAVAIVAQSFIGHADWNSTLAEHGRAPMSWLAYATSSHFVVDVAENWQSEFLQFFLFIAATVWLVERGSPESKKPGDEGLGSDREQLVGEHARPDSPAWARAGGWRRRIYSNSLLLVMGGAFALSWLAQALAGRIAANAEASLTGGAPMTLGEYLASPDFWSRSVQNWQSELLAIGAMAVLSIYLRQRGSSESKPVGMPHGVTSVESD